MELRSEQLSDQTKITDHWRAGVLVLFLFGACLSFVLLFCLTADLTSVDAIKVYQQINPNTAPAGSLIRLEGIGPVRANDLIQFRTRAADPSRAFQYPQDLEAIRGIGPKTVDKIKAWLVFDSTGPEKYTGKDDGRMGN